MKVKLLRDHLENKKGDTIEVTPERANYFKLIGLIAGEGKAFSDAEDKSVKKAAKKTASKKTKK